MSVYSIFLIGRAKSRYIHVIKTIRYWRWRRYLLHEVGQEGVGFIVAHPVAVDLHQHLEEGVQEVQRLEVDGGVRLEEPERDPAKEKVQAADSSLLVGGIT